MQALALALCVLGGTNPFDNYVYDPLVGESVVVVHDKAEFTTSDGDSGKLPLALTLQITAADGDVLQADNQGRTISIQRSDVLEPPEAIAYFQQEVKQSPSADLYFALGATLQQLERFDESLKAFDAALQIDPEMAKAYLRRGWTKLQQRKHDEALADFSQVIRRRDQPGSEASVPYAYLWRASCWQAKGDLEHAISDCSVFLSKNPNHVPVLVSRAQLWASRGDICEARDDFDVAVRLAPNDAALRLGRMTFRGTQCDFARVVEDGEAAIRLDSHGLIGDAARKITAFILAASRDDAIRDANRAIWHADELVRRDRRSSLALLTAAAAYAEAGDFNNAIALQQSAILWVGNSAQSLPPGKTLNKASLERQLSQYEKHQPWRDDKEPSLLFFPGEKLFVTADSVDLHDDEGRNVGTLWSCDVVTLERVEGLRCFVKKGAMCGWVDGHRLQAFGDGIECCDLALQQAPTARHYCDRAIHLMLRSDFERARADHDRAIALDPDSPVFLCERGLLRVFAGDAAGAAVDFEESLRRDPKLANAYGNRGMMKLANGDVLGAMADLDEAIRLNPQKWSHRRNRGTLLMTLLGEHERGLADLDEVIRLNPEGSDAAEARFQRAWYLKRKGRFEEALAEVTEAVRIAPYLTDGHSHVAWILATCPVEELRDGDAALEHALTACRLSRFAKASALEALAAAYAEQKDFKKAVEWQQVALELADAKEREEFESRLKEYESGRPYRHAPKFDPPTVKLPVKAVRFESHKLNRRFHAGAFSSPRLSPTIGVEKG